MLGDRDAQSPGHEMGSPDRRIDGDSQRLPIRDRSVSPAERASSLQAARIWQDVMDDYPYEPSRGLGAGLIMLALCIVGGIIAFHYFLR